MLAAAAATFLLGLLAASILQRREEARQKLPLQPIGKWETDGSAWGVNYPREHEAYKRMEDSTTRTEYGGAFPRDYLAETPAYVILYAGYGFAKQYQQARGHVHSIEDVTETRRVNETTPATCWTCKSTDVPRLMDEMGAAEFYASNFLALKPEITHPIGCLDCHEPNTMRLRITRPALREALARQGKDIERATHQQMRSLVCAQCHVEYYFKGEGDYLVFPWDKGTTPEDMERYYDAAEFADWTHAISRTRMVKLQHPDYEIYTTGIHAYRDIACADCHMPYRTEGGVKFTDHHIRSPLLNLSNSCAVCHRWPEEEIRRRVVSGQDKVREGREMAERALARAHFDVAAAIEAGAGDEELAEARNLLRGGQLRWDYVAASNSMGFHSPQECTRILAAAIDMAGRCRVECARILARHGYDRPVEYPDCGAKEKAQALNRRYIEGRPPKLLKQLSR